MTPRTMLAAATALMSGAALFLGACGAGAVQNGSAPSAGASAPIVSVQASPAAASSGAPAASAQPAGPKAYVGLFKDNAVGVIDTSSNKLLTTIPVPAGPHGLVIAPDGRKVYVSSDGDSKVSVIDAATDRLVSSIEVGQTPHGLAMSKDGKQVVVSGFGSDQAEVIDTASARVVQTYPAPAAHNSAISPDGRLLYVGSQKKDAPALLEFDLTTGLPVATFPVKNQPRSLNFSADGKLLYFTLVGSDAVGTLDVFNKKLLPEIPTGAAPHHVLVTPDGKQALTVAQGPGELDVIDASKSVVTNNIKVGAAPHWIGLSSDAKTAYVTNESSNDVSIVHLPMGMVMGTISQVGNAPRKIALQPGLVGAPAAAPAAAKPTTPSAAAPASGQLKLGNVTYSDRGTQDVKGQTTVTVVVDDFFFSPTFLSGAPGSNIALQIQNKSGTLHNISVPSQQIDKDIKAHETVTVEVTVPQSGALRFFCKYHTALGMNGELLAGNAAPQAAA